jgi:hypothetical protein
MARGLARPGQVKMRLGKAQEERLEALIEAHTITALANRWRVSPQTLEGVRFGGSAQPPTIEKLRALIAREGGHAGLT